jgi:hypothetical protein
MRPSTIVQFSRRAVVAALTAFLCGCATNSQSVAPTATRDLDCSFRSPTTCWSVGGRFPSRKEQQPFRPELIIQDSSTVLASTPDSLRSSQQ